MTEEAKVRSVALFYFFAFMDEAVAKLATETTLDACNRKISKENLPNEKWSSLIVSETNRGWHKYKDYVGRDINVEVPGETWILADKVSLGQWKEFLKSSDENELKSVVWSQILGFLDDDISSGLGISSGNVRFRVSRGLRHLGRLQH